MYANTESQFFLRGKKELAQDAPLFAKEKKNHWNVEFLRRPAEGQLHSHHSVCATWGVWQTFAYFIRLLSGSAQNCQQIAKELLQSYVSVCSTRTAHTFNRIHRLKQVCLFLYPLRPKPFL